MPILSSSMSSTIKVKALSKGLVGRDMPRVAKAASSAVSSYVLTNAVVNTTDNVLGPGAGSGTGIIIGLVPSSMSGLMYTKGLSLGLAGKDAKSFFDSVAFGVVTELGKAVATTAVIGGGPGVGTGIILGLSTTVLQGLISSLLIGNGIIGTFSGKLATAISFGVIISLTTQAKVQMSDVGGFAPPPFGPIPVIGLGIGRLA